MVQLGAFGKHAERMLDNGFQPVPVNGKVPMIRSWNGRPMGARAINNLIQKNGQIAQAGLALRTGELFAIDIDIEDQFDAYQAMTVVFSVLGETPFIRVGRFPRRALLYRLDAIVDSLTVGRIEVLGANKLVTVAGIHPITGDPYYWPEQCLIETHFSTVPLVSDNQIEHLVQVWHRDFLYGQAVVEQPAPIRRTASRALAASIAADVAIKHLRKHSTYYTQGMVGERNNKLFRDLKDQANNCLTKGQLSSMAVDINASFYAPLPPGEVQSVVESVWNYKAQGKLLVRGRQQILLPISKNDILELSQEALKLLLLLKATRKTKTFTIPQKATAKKIGWGSNRLKKAIDALSDRGLLCVVGIAGVRKPIKYQFASSLA